MTLDYNIEGSDLGYRWNRRVGKKALFPFGFGLSYTNFSYSGLKTNGRTATMTVANTGGRAGASVAQVYLLSRNGQATQRLVGFERVELNPGEAKQVRMTIDPRLLADWNGKGWTIPAGQYSFAYGENAETLGPVQNVKLPAKSWR